MLWFNLQKFLLWYLRNLCIGNACRKKMGIFAFDVPYLNRESEMLSVVTNLDNKCWVEWWTKVMYSEKWAINLEHSIWLDSLTCKPATKRGDTNKLDVNFDEVFRFRVYIENTQLWRCGCCPITICRIQLQTSFVHWFTIWQWCWRKDRVLKPSSREVMLVRLFAERVGLAYWLTWGYKRGRTGEKKIGRKMFKLVLEYIKGVANLTWTCFWHKVNFLYPMESLEWCIY